MPCSVPSLDALPQNSILISISGSDTKGYCWLHLHSRGWSSVPTLGYNCLLKCYGHRLCNALCKYSVGRSSVVDKSWLDRMYVKPKQSVSRQMNDSHTLQCTCATTIDSSGTKSSLQAQILSSQCFRCHTKSTATTAQACDLRRQPSGNMLLGVLNHHIQHQRLKKSCHRT